jgi:F-box/leucine-rich repeat protein 2/20
VDDDALFMVVQAHSSGDVRAPLRVIKFGECDLITDEGVSILSSALRDVEYLHAGWCEDLSEVAIASMLRTCTRLAHLQLRRCGNLTDVPLRSLSCWNLRTVDVARCEYVGDEGICSLAEHSPLLEDLDASWTSVSNRSLASLGRSSLLLRRLNVEGCRKISDEGLASLVDSGDGCRRLEFLSIGWIPGVSEHGVNLILRWNGRLSELHIPHCGVRRLLEAHRHPYLTVTN